MNIIVKDMKMPDHCWECWLMRNLICGASGELIPSTGKRKHCPLVALPDKHGRLIDADKLKSDNPRHMDADVPYVTEVTVEEIIDYAPTVIEAEGG